MNTEGVGEGDSEAASPVSEGAQMSFLCLRARISARRKCVRSRHLLAPRSARRPADARTWQLRVYHSILISCALLEEK